MTWMPEQVGVAVTLWRHVGKGGGGPIGISVGTSAVLTNFREVSVTGCPDN
jgi:hypothetical protein